MATHTVNPVAAQAISVDDLQAQLATVTARLAAVAGGNPQPTAPVLAVAPTAKGKSKAKAAPVGNGAINTPLAFYTVAIRKLAAASGGKSKGIHTRFSGVLEAFAMQFNTTREQAIAHMEALVNAGHLEKRPAKAGWMIYLAGEMPQRTVDKDPAEVLGLILG